MTVQSSWFVVLSFGHSQRSAVRIDQKELCLDGQSSVAGVIGVACEDCKCAIELLGQHDAG